MNFNFKDNIAYLTKVKGILVSFSLFQVKKHEQLRVRVLESTLNSIFLLTRFDYNTSHIIFNLIIELQICSIKCLNM